MTPSDIQLLAEAISAKGISFPWYAYISSIVVAAISLYLANYLTTKASLRATNENFENLNEQVKKTTQDTEAIKITLSGSSWLSQQQWALREKYYVELLTQLNKLYLTLLDRSEYYLEPKSEHDMTIAEKPRFVALAKRGADALNEIRQLMGPASIFLSDSAIQSLQNLVRDHWNVAFDSHPDEYVTRTLELVSKANAEVLAEAKKQLSKWPDAPSSGRLPG
jgi:hypothetical protein